MDTRKNRNEPRDNTPAAADQKPLKGTEGTLKDLAPETGATRHVKGGIPKQRTNTGDPS